MCGGSWKSRGREAKTGTRTVRQTDLMLTSTAIVAGDRWPVGCAVLVVALLSLLLWALLWILLWQLFSTPGGADLQENPLVIGVIHNQSSTGLAGCDPGTDLVFQVGSRDREKIPDTLLQIVLAVSCVLCVRLRVSTICWTRLALR